MGYLRFFCATCRAAAARHVAAGAAAAHDKKFSLASSRYLDRYFRRRISEHVNVVRTVMIHVTVIAAGNRANPGALGYFAERDRRTRRDRGENGKATALRYEWSRVRDSNPW